MPAAYISPIVIERDYTWEANFDIKAGTTARDLNGWSAFLTASGIYLTGTVSGTAGRVTFGRTSAQTSAYNFDRINYEIRLISGVTAERMALGELVLSTGMR